MPSVADADKLARLIKEAQPLVQEFARAPYDARRELRDKCGVALSFLTLYLNSIAMDDQPTFDGSEEDGHDKALKVAHHGTVQSRLYSQLRDTLDRDLCAASGLASAPLYTAGESCTRRPRAGR